MGPSCGDGAGHEPEVASLRTRNASRARTSPITTQAQSAHHAMRRICTLTLNGLGGGKIDAVRAYRVAFGTRGFCLHTFRGPCWPARQASPLFSRYICRPASTLHRRTSAMTERQCGCRACAPEPSVLDFGVQLRFYACCKCGNKRCPHATDHRLQCSGSNEPGQIGSVYGVTLSEPEIVARLRFRQKAA